MVINRRDCDRCCGLIAVLRHRGDKEAPEAMIDESLPLSGFTKKSTADVTQGLDLSGQVGLVTGCNSGLGLETMRVLALRGAHILARDAHCIKRRRRAIK